MKPRAMTKAVSYRRLCARLAALACAALGAASTVATQRAQDNQLAARVQQLTRASVWTLERSQPLAFPTYHPQGLVKIGDTLFVSSVEVRVPTRRSANRTDGFDRDAGEGVGHLFKVTSAGALVQDLVLGEGTMYHPSGIDFDGTHIWLAVAEYRPNSRSIVYRVDPTTMKATEMFRFDDHLGGLVRNTDDNTLHAVSWGSRWFYRWTLDKTGRPTDVSGHIEKMRTANPSHYVDYQDCKYAGDGRMLCSGIADITRGNGEKPLQLGGIDLIDLRTGLPVHQLPVGVTTANGISLTRNPSFFEVEDEGVRAYFLPEDDKSTLYVYRISTLHEKPSRAQEVTDPIADVALKRHAIVGRRTADAARALQVAAQVGEERGVVRQSEDHGDGLSAASLLLNAEFGDRPSGDRLTGGGGAAAAPFGLPTAAANLPRGTRVDDPDIVAVFHDVR